MINAGKSALNEDQACCEVVVARRRPMSYCPPSTPSKTPTAKRRNSLPNGEGLGLRIEHSKLGEVHKKYTNTHCIECASLFTRSIECTYMMQLVLHSCIHTHTHGAAARLVKFLSNQLENKFTSSTVFLELFTFSLDTRHVRLNLILKTNVEYDHFSPWLHV